uniref:Ig-like domain-containing protein n=1 Tax=Lates calcarifer TaxID=8187 RepID=A0A4W6FAQ7_LATCA
QNHKTSKVINLHKNNALISVTTAQLGEPVTLSCFFPESEYSNTRIKWYKQTIGDTLLLITTLMKATAYPTFEEGFPSSRFNVNHTTTSSILTILRTVQEDEAMYHCAVTTWSKDQWSGVYLSFKGNTFLSDSEKSSCSAVHSVHWFGVRSDKSLPHIIYADGNRPYECDKRPDARSPPKSCVYRFSKTVSSSDAGTYYCAVDMCGEILFGNGSKLDIEGNCIRILIINLSLIEPFHVSGTNLWSFGGLLRDSMMLYLLCALFTISVIVTSLLIYTIKKNQCDYCNADDIKATASLFIFNLMIFIIMILYCSCCFPARKCCKKDFHGKINL